MNHPIQRHCMAVCACVWYWLMFSSHIRIPTHPIQHCSVHWAWVWLLAEWGWTLTWEPVRSPCCREVGVTGWGSYSWERKMPRASKQSTGIVLQLHRGIPKWDCAWQTGHANWQLSLSIQWPSREMDYRQCPGYQLLTADADQGSWI